MALLLDTDAADQQDQPDQGYAPPAQPQQRPPLADMLRGLAAQRSGAATGQGAGRVQTAPPTASPQTRQPGMIYPVGAGQTAPPTAGTRPPLSEMLRGLAAAKSGRPVAGQGAPTTGGISGDSVNQPPSGFFSRAGQTAAELGKGVVKSTLRGLGGAANLAADTAATVTGGLASLPAVAANAMGFPETAASLSQIVDTPFTDPFGMQGGARVIGNTILDSSKAPYYQRGERAAESAAAPGVTATNPEGFAAGLGEMIPATITGTGVTLATGNPALGLGAASIMGGGQSYAGRMEQGQSKDTAVPAALMDAAIEAITEIIPISEIAKGTLSKSGPIRQLVASKIAQNIPEPVLKFVLRGGVGAAEEGLAEIGQAINDYTIGKNPNAFEGLGPRVLAAMGGGFGLEGAMGLAGGPVRQPPKVPAGLQQGTGTPPAGLPAGEGGPSYSVRTEGQTAQQPQTPTRPATQTPPIGLPGGQKPGRGTEAPTPNGEVPRETLFNQPGYSPVRAKMIREWEGLEADAAEGQITPVGMNRLDQLRRTLEQPAVTPQQAAAEVSRQAQGVEQQPPMQPIGVGAQANEQARATAEQMIPGRTPAADRSIDIGQFGEDRSIDKTRPEARATVGETPSATATPQGSQAASPSPQSTRDLGSLSAQELRQSFERQGPGHAKASREIGAMVAQGTLRDVDADVLYEALHNTPTEALGKATFVSNTAIRRVGQMTWNNAAKTGRIQLRAGLAKIADSPIGKWFSAPDVQASVIALHEFAHFAHYAMLGPAEGRIIRESFAANKGGAAAHFKAGLSGEEGQQKHYAADADEWFAQNFAEWVIGNKVSDSRLNAIFQRIGEFFRKAVERLRGRGQGNVKALEPLFELLVGHRTTQTQEQTNADGQARVQERGQGSEQGEQPLRPQGDGAVQQGGKQTPAAAEPFQAESEAVRAQGRGQGRTPGQSQVHQVQTREGLNTEAVGRETQIVLPGGKTLPARYVLVEADSILPSHDARKGFAVNEGADPNERRYDDPTEGKASRKTVEDIAAKPNPDLLLTDSPTATDGPPIVGPTGIVLGGNARTMAVQLAYARGKAAGDLIRRSTLAAAERFGIGASATGKIAHPVLVRVLSAEHAGKPGELSRALNQPLTTGRTEITDAVSRGSRLGEQGAAEIAGLIGDDTIRQALDSPRKSQRISQIMRDAGAFTDAELTGFMRGGEFTDSGKIAVERALLGAAVPDVRSLAEAPDSFTRTLVRGLPALVRLNRTADRGGDPGFKATLANAAEGLATMRRTGAPSVGAMMREATIHPEDWRNDQRAVSLMLAFESDTPTAFAKRLSEYAGAVEDAQSGQSRLLGDVQSIDDAFDEIFGQEEGQHGPDVGGQLGMFGDQGEVAKPEGTQGDLFGKSGFRDAPNAVGPKKAARSGELGTVSPTLAADDAQREGETAAEYAARRKHRGAEEDTIHLFGPDPEESRAIEARAATHFGITTDKGQAGYVLSDGRMLDLSGIGMKGKQHRVIGPGKRGLDHDDLADLVPQGTDAQRRSEFLAAGPVRVDFPKGLVEIGGPIQDRQMMTIARGLVGAKAVHIEAGTGRGSPAYFKNLSNPSKSEIVKALFDAQSAAESMGKGGGSRGGLTEIGSTMRAFRGGDESTHFGPDAGDEANAQHEQRNTDELGFYSAVERTIAAKMKGPMQSDQMLKMLHGAQLSPDEIKWTGLEEFLGGEPRKITPEAMKEYLAENRVVLKERVLGQGPEDGKMAKAVGQFDMASTHAGRVLRSIDVNAHHRLEDEARAYGGGAHPTIEEAFDAFLRPYGEDQRARLSDLSATFHQMAAASRITQELNQPGGRQSQPARYEQFTLPGGPLARDTEILTIDGWKRIDEITIGTLVMTRRDSGGLLEWAPVEATPRVWAEVLYHFKNQSIDMLTTACHQMVAFRRRRGANGKALIRVRADQLWTMSEMSVPLKGTWKAPRTPRLFGLDAGDVAEFVGWFLAEGHSVKSRPHGRKSTVCIAQSRTANPDHCARIEALFGRLGFRWSYTTYKSGGAYNVHIKTMPRPFVDLLHAQGLSGEKRVPALFFSCDLATVKRLLESLLLGDGSFSKTRGRQRRWTFFSKSKSLADGVQTLALLTGGRGTVLRRPSGLYTVGLGIKDAASIDDAKRGIVPYGDWAFCVTVRNHAIYVRRNGIAAFTGNSNYREVLLTLPEAPTSEKISPDKDAKAKYGAEFDALAKESDERFSKVNLSSEELAARDEIESRMDAIHRKMVQETALRLSPAKRVAGYRSSHFPEPNIIAHARIKDRTTPDGKRVLFAEEVQSDWGQSGREKGFRGTPISELPEGFKAVEIPADHANFRGPMRWTVWDAQDQEIHASDPIRANTKQDAIDNYIAWHNAETTRGKPPPMPFSKTWHEMTFRRLVRMAAEGGYDAIAWTTGDQQAERYSIAERVEAIHWRPSSGTLSVVEHGVRGVAGGRIIAHGVAADRLADYVGQGAAESLQNAPEDTDEDGTRTIRGNDLRIGGEGMREFYDRILPRYASKFGKKWGAKAERGIVSDQIGDGGKQPINSDVFLLPITPAMRDSVLGEGVNLFGPDPSDPSMFPNDFYANPAPRGKPQGEPFDTNRPPPPHEVLAAEAFARVHEEVTTGNVVTRQLTHWVGRADNVLKSFAAEVASRATGRIEAAVNAKERVKSILEQAAAATFTDPAEAGRLRTLAERITQAAESAEKAAAMRKDAAGSIRGFSAKMPHFARIAQAAENTDRLALDATLKGVSKPDIRDLALLGMGYKKASEVSETVRALNAKMLRLMDHGESGMAKAAALGLRRRGKDGKMRKLRGSGHWMPQSLNAEGRKVLKDIGEKGLASPRLAALADEMVSSGSFETQEEAAKAIFEYIDARTRGVNHYFERARVPLPERFLDLNVRRVIPNMLRMNARTVAAGKTFGGFDETNELPDLAHLTVLLRQYGMDAGGSLSSVASAMEKYLGIELGKPPGSLTQRKIARNILAVQNAAKLSGLFTPLRNLGQPAVNLADMGVIPRLRAYFVDYPLAVGDLTPRGKSSRRAATLAGTTSDRGGMTDLPEGLGPSAATTISNVLGFFQTRSERGNQIRSHMIGRHAAEQGLRQLVALEGRSGRLRRLWAIAANGFGSSRVRAAVERRMKRLGLTPDVLASKVAKGERLSESELQIAGWLASHDSQFTMTTASKPLFYETNPLMRIPAQYKMFGVRQTGLLWDRYIKEAAMGNVRPLASMLIAALIVGELVAVLRDYLTGSDRAASGLKDRKAKGLAADIAKRVGKHLASTGALGTVGDVNRGLDEFLLGPSFGTVLDATQAGTDFLRRPTLTQAGLAGRKLAESQAPMLNQYREIVRRVLTHNERAILTNTIKSRARNFAAEQHTEGWNEWLADRVKESIIGLDRYGSSGGTLVHQYAARAITAGEKPSATSYMADLISGAKDDAALDKVLTGLRSSMTKSSPLGGMNEKMRRDFLNSMKPEQRKVAEDLDREWKRDYSAALRDAAKQARESRRKGH